MKNKLNIIVFFLVVSIVCTNHNISLKKRCYPIDKEKEILEMVSNEIIAQNTGYINSRKEWKCTQPLFLNIYQQKGETSEFKFYTAFFSESGLYEEMLPTYLWTKQDVYIVIYLDSREVISKSDIPENLLRDYDDCSIYESSWLILICKNTYKTKVIDIGLVHHLAVKQFQDFSCDVESGENRKIKIEDAIVDTVLMKKIMQSLPISDE